MVRTVEPFHMDILRHIAVVTSANRAIEQEFRARKVVSYSQRYDVYLGDWYQVLVSAETRDWKQTPFNRHYRNITPVDDIETVCEGLRRGKFVTREHQKFLITAKMCFGGGRNNQDEAVIIKTRVRPRPSYDERIYIQEPARRNSRYRYEQELVSRSRSGSHHRREIHEDPRRSSRTVVSERKVSRTYRD